MTDLPALPDVAIEQFRVRQQNAGVAVAEERVTLAQAEAGLRPWAAIALAVGATLGELLPDQADARVEVRSLRGPEWPRHREFAATDLCPWDTMLAVLRAARDQAIDRGNTEAARPLIRLGEALGPLPPYSAKPAHPEQPHSGVSKGQPARKAA